MANNRFQTIGPEASLTELAKHNTNWSQADAALNAIEAGIIQKQTNIDAEVQARTAAVQTEQQARIAADQAEATARIAADSTEKSERIAAVDAEAQARINADSVEAAARSGGDATEAAARLAADNAHATSTSAHDADSITFTPGTSGLSSAKAGAAIKEVNTRVSNIIAGTGGGSQEVVDARQDNAGVTYPTLKAREDAELGYLTAVDIARADLIRLQAHSGVNDYSTKISNNANNAPFSDYSNGGIAFYTNSASKSSNKILIGGFNAFINGYKLHVATTGKDSNGLDVSDLILPEPPTYGTREDLVFLEAWFPQTGTKGQLSWRIRTVAGVDFNIWHMDGFSAGTGGRNSAVLAQGGQSSVPMTPTTYLTFNRADLLGLQSDVGLYIAGTGDATSKSTLLTADGYVYAIPLFRIKRRNSGGYRKDNLNGARDYYTLDFTGKTQATAGMTIGSTSMTATTLTNLYVGDKIMVDAISYVITSVNGTTIMLDKGLSFSYNPSNWTQFVVPVVNHRPDGLYSNIIDASDIIDLRHKVSLTGVNYQQSLEENFDRLLRGDLTTKDTKTSIKETYGLKRAPLGLSQQLQSTTIKRADGTNVDLVNLLGTDGSCEDASKLSVSANATATLDPNNKTTGNYGLKLTTVSNSTFAYILGGKLNNMKYYILIADVKNGNATNIVTRYYNGTSNVGTVTTTSSAAFSKAYIKLQPSNIGTTTQNFAFDVNGGSGQYAYIDSARIYEIDQATYNLIDVDPNWTGGDNIAAKFPYVDSLPNFVENLYSGGFTAVGGSYIEPNSSTVEVTSTATASSYASSRRYTVLPNTTYTFSYIGTTVSGVDIPTVDIRKGSNSAPHASVVGAGQRTVTFNTGIETELILYFYGSTGTAAVQTKRYENIQLEIGSTINPFVPYGRWYLDKDYQGFNTHLGNNCVNRYEGVNGGRLTAQRSIFSDAQTSETRLDIVEALKTPQSHIKVIQAVEGQWAVGDKIIISSNDGVVAGLIDSDTAYAKILSRVSDSVFIVDDVSKLAVNDTFKLSRFAETPPEVGTITAIDTTTKQVTFTGVVYTQNAFDGGWIYMIETTTSSSIPTVTAAGIVGTWTNLGTKAATYTIGTAPTDNKANISMQYSVNYPAGKGFSYVPTDILKAEVNDDEVKPSNTVSVKANYVGKVINSTDLVPHIMKASGNPVLQAPTGTWGTPSQTQQDNVSSLNSSSYMVSSTVNLDIAQTIFSFDLIRAVEDKYGEIPADGVAAKVAWLVNNVSSRVISWHGYGSSPTGNKATLALWNAQTLSWGTTATNTASTPTLISQSFSASYAWSQMIDATGFVHVLAYADASNGTTASTINTDYVELSLTLNTAEIGYTVLQPTNPFPVMSENLLTANQALPVDTGAFIVTGSAIMSVVDSPRQAIRVTNAIDSSTNKFDVAFSQVAGKYYTVSAVVYNPGTTDITISISHGGGGNKAWLLKSGERKYISNTPNLVGVTAQSSLRLYEATGAAFHVESVKAQEGTLATDWTAGRKKKVTLNYLNKSEGNLTNNPSRTLARALDTFQNPISGTWYEFGNVSYTSLSKQDGVLANYQGTGIGQYAQQLFEFDLSQLGMSLSELKKALRKFTVSWTGYGKGDNAGVATFGATLKWWRSDTSTWTNGGAIHTNTTNSPTTVTVSSPSHYTFPADSGIVLTKDQKFYILVHSTYPAGVASQSEIYTDYIKLDVELADYMDYVPSNIVKVRPETKEIKTFFPATSRRYLGGGQPEQQIALWYRYVPYQGLGDASKTYKVLGLGDAYLTSLGTAKISPYAASVPFVTKPIIPNLPSQLADYLFVADDMILKNDAITAADFDIVEQGVLNIRRIGIDGYRYGSPVGNLVTIVANLAGSIAFRGFKPNTSATSYYAYQNFLIANVLAKAAPHLTAVPLLVADISTWELMFMVVTTAETTNKISESRYPQQAIDVFKLPGRPLVKGV
ncbi:hypothetical protein [Paenibacillus radicis (ex Xue et al. 2023)]|uniref:Uncharacterized protein n=1 Tax=Paenibacillus radicis (ex Xue et al. 2023) TaxID=2972489 RepID=A0ABT1YJX7_9BACL|nr:hypothetical protein [Paenibacillus radicis (ex Xue et al. 2023)]MCR8633497.1 hypothetical protein [Paenibacillus radicis (ex Xue et al. 2023)]